MNYRKPEFELVLIEDDLDIVTASCIIDEQDIDTNPQANNGGVC